MPMWAIDLYHDYEWIKQNGSTAEPRIHLPINIGSLPNLNAQLFIFGTDTEFKHAQIQLDVKTKEECEEFFNQKLHFIVTSLELVLSIAYGQPFHFYKIPGSTNTFVSYGEIIDAKHQPLQITPQFSDIKLDYEFIKQALGHRYPGLEDYELFFLRGVDTTLDHDYRWLNFYKIFERKFNKKGKNKLINEKSWIMFLEQYRKDIKPFLSNDSQTLQGLIEELRASAAHSINGLDTRIANKRLSATLPLVVAMSKQILNEHENNKGLIFT